MLNNILQKSIAPVLKQYGFRKKGLTWNKSVDRKIQVINFQLSNFDSKQFTINLGIFYPQLWERCWLKKSPTFIQEDDCFPRIRAGDLIDDTISKEKKDIWWSYEKTADWNVLADEIFDLIDKKCIFFLDSMLEDSEIVKFTSSGDYLLTPIDKIYLSILFYDIGKYELFEQMVGDVASVSDGWSSRVSQIRHSLGLS